MKKKQVWYYDKTKQIEQKENKNRWQQKEQQ